ncbi:PREDICTED: uncharacterized protein LOC105312008 [Amphimedon queenslandica]|uniref:Transcription factor CBF/NF-Y/archaeal histone domain-containing protein n=1 Tax=Amphimedon queenslandica TaxID=400682 RepID=A0A1X7VBQ7_AMPQE|nr:PREDICTED: uncharacterized protein LOC105312008 [Amphimedon queenslandica]|eukprot:XP_011402600.1 PREDICTED: uncharacterized protein LOC105312008 [Amphimedon queenslandica]
MAELGVLDDPMELDPSLRQSRTPGLPTDHTQGYGARDVIRAHIQAGGGVLNSSLRHGGIPLLETDKQHVVHATAIQDALQEDDLNCATPQSLRFDFPSEEELQQPKTRQVVKRPPPAIYRDQDRFVPINNISRTMRNCVPKSGKVSKDAKECMQECVSEFIGFLTSEASDRCIDEKRKTITGDDILFSLSTLGFDCYVDTLQVYLKKYREHLRSDKNDKEYAQGSPSES